MRALLARWLLRLAAAGVIVGALAYIPYRVYGSEGYVRYRALVRLEADLERAIAELRRENQTLRRDVRRLRDDLEAVATVARDELGMVGAGELVIQIDRPGRGGPGTP